MESASAAVAADLKAYGHSQLIKSLIAWKKSGAEPSKLLDHGLFLNWYLPGPDTYKVYIHHESGGMFSSGLAESVDAGINAVLGISHNTHEPRQPKDLHGQPKDTNHEEKLETPVDPEIPPGYQPIDRDRQRELRGALATLAPEKLKQCVEDFSKDFDLPSGTKRIGDRITQQCHATWIEEWLAKLS